MKIKVGTYTAAKGENYGMNALYVQAGSLTVWFSYDTIIAFQDGVEDRVGLSNPAGSTTAKHLGLVCPEYRLAQDDFDKALHAAFDKHGVWIEKD